MIPRLRPELVLRAIEGASSGQHGGTGGQKTDWRYTGQRWQNDLGMYWYNSRWYDQLTGRFLQPDTIVPNPGNPGSLNRYAYVMNNPLRYTDPTGMFSEDETMKYLGVKTWEEERRRIEAEEALAGA